MCIAASRAKGFHLVIERLPIAGQSVPTRDDDVDFVCPGAHAFLDLGHTQMKRRQSGRKAGRDCGNRNACSLKRTDGSFNHIVIDANSTSGEVVYAQR